MKRNTKDRGYGYKKSYNYEDSIKEIENLIPIPTTFNDAWDFIIEEEIATESECR